MPQRPGVRPVTRSRCVPPRQHGGRGRAGGERRGERRGAPTVAVHGLKPSRAGVLHPGVVPGTVRVRPPAKPRSGLRVRRMRFTRLRGGDVHWMAAGVRVRRGPVQKPGGELRQTAVRQNQTAHCARVRHILPGGDHAGRVGGYRAESDVLRLQPGQVAASHS